ncbi:uncharacterized protein [Arachis hypogaea]|uniref:uncharacterized protein n=1 Tax=Arachis hypogaea TaxID=3818 RepID=UPI003B2218DE
MTPTLFKKHTTADICERREKGLYYYCNEKYVPGHCCKATYQLLMGQDQLHELLQEKVEGKAGDAGSDSEDKGNNYERSTPRISLNALEGEFHPETLRVRGTHGNRPLLILINGGSTHNFVKGLVGNKDSIHCGVKHMGLALLVQGYDFAVNAYILDLKRADVVLGIHWMMRLGTIRINYMELFMKFKVSSNWVIFKSERLLKEGSLNCRELIKLQESKAIASLFHLEAVESRNNKEELTTNDDEVQQILKNFLGVFEEPIQLPPLRMVNHSIHLVLKNAPMSVRPYKYLHFQKVEMERLVDEMLQVGVIRNSQSAFSSPVLLVKKKDGGWRFNVDYRALNAITVKDKFPIPTIDEILHELHGAVNFSKIDLRSGYHQLRMRSKKEHMAYLSQALKVLRDNQFFAKRSKCSFFQEQVEHLGHVITVAGVQLLKKNTFHWTLESEQTFVQLKKLMTHTPVLALLDFSKPFVVETNVSRTGVGAVLSQESDHVAYLVRILGFGKFNKAADTLSRQVEEGERFHFQAFAVVQSSIISAIFQDNQEFEELLTMQERLQKGEWLRITTFMMGYSCIREKSGYPSLPI